MIGRQRRADRGVDYVDDILLPLLRTAAILFLFFLFSLYLAHLLHFYLIPVPFIHPLYFNFDAQPSPKATLNILRSTNILN